ncbi:hypothetical protein COOONC_04919 [Cooperia oncophora]
MKIFRVQLCLVRIAIINSSQQLYLERLVLYLLHQLLEVGKRVPGVLLVVRFHIPQRLAEAHAMLVRNSVIHRQLAPSLYHQRNGFVKHTLRIRTLAR